MTNILYLTRNGLLEPLGQSQVWPYIRSLSSSYKITVVSFEKPVDLCDSKRMHYMSALCRQHHVKWIPLSFRSKPRVLAPILGLAALFFVTILQFISSAPPRLIHARSYVPCAIALIINYLFRTPFIFDMRALWPEELITAQRVSRGSFLHRLLVLLERSCLASANAVVCLTNASVAYLKSTYPQELKGKPLVVIPTCVDLERFTPTTLDPSAPLVIGCVGTLLSGWFRLDLLHAFFSAVARIHPSAHFELISREDPSEIHAALNPSPSWIDRLTIKCSLPEDIPSLLHSHSASAMFYAGGSISELGRSPTRMAEVLASGRPVIVNTGIGDVEHVIRSNRVGILLSGTSRIDMDVSAKELLALLKDQNLSFRCRRTAQQHFSLGGGVDAYSAIYSDILLSPLTK